MTQATHCKRGHLLSGPNLYLRKNGWRDCRTCRSVIRATRPQQCRQEQAEAKILMPALLVEIGRAWPAVLVSSKPRRRLSIEMTASYLAHTLWGWSTGRCARHFGVDSPAINVRVAAVEDARDDAAFDRVLTRLEAKLKRFIKETSPHEEVHVPSPRSRRHLQADQHDAAVEGHDGRHRAPHGHWRGDEAGVAARAGA